MALEAFKEKKWRDDDLALIGEINDILADFQGQGIPKVTLRQVYYVLVSRNRITNKTQSYARLSDIVSDARLCGLMDWDSFVDKGREAAVPTWFTDLSEFVDNAVHWHALDRWEGQDNYIEIWTEKAGMGTFMQPFAQKWQLPFFANRGYGSQTAMYEASKRFLEAVEHGKEPHLLYLGDHDPSGLDMDRDIEERLKLFGVDDITVHRIALTTAQVRQHRPPPNPAKLTDSRAPAYIEQFGQTSWEVDALNPTILRQLTDKRIRDLVDLDLLNAVIEREKKDRVRLKAAVRRISEGTDEAEE